MGTHKDLIAYKKAFDVAMRIFEITKQFPKEEKYSLIDQIRRSSRAVCINIAEAYRKRIYPAHFIAKISDADMESTETQTWLDFALSCNYLNKQDYEHCMQQMLEIGRLLYHMQMYPEKYQPKTVNLK
ncbi:four helix bundle protein [Chitinophaga japonensis]|uniref:Four helix bundle protein n=1 Tax=Chitinophaga japonensis TaxID=104662 RepID=A0A562T5U1_CHIJA|nr:four helix bundle protein [Chitinophaga japonensis]TWI88895.1 four helix bundle protein [Chitinophaga japonensis]